MTMPQRISLQMSMFITIEQVRILRREDDTCMVVEPDEHPQGMGVAGLLKSELFGLRSTVDTETLRRLDKRNYLFALGRARNKIQDAELTRLSEELPDLGFASDFKDPYFAMFVRKMALHKKFHKPQKTFIPIMMLSISVRKKNVRI